MYLYGNDGVARTGRKEKNARKFNLQEMFETTRRTAHNYSAQVRGTTVIGWASFTRGVLIMHKSSMECWRVGVLC